jgi:hypothetical protein
MWWAAFFKIADPPQLFSEAEMESKEKINPFTKTCPCYQCLCIPICKIYSTNDLTKRCELVKEFYYDGHPYHYYTRFVAIRECFNKKYSYANYHRDWKNLLDNQRRLPIEDYIDD